VGHPGASVNPHRQSTLASALNHRQRVGAGLRARQVQIVNASRCLGGGSPRRKHHPSRQRRGYAGQQPPGNCAFLVRVEASRPRSAPVPRPSRPPGRPQLRRHPGASRQFVKVRHRPGRRRWRRTLYALPTSRRAAARPQEERQVASTSEVAGSIAEPDRSHGFAPDAAGPRRRGKLRWSWGRAVGAVGRWPKGLPAWPPHSGRLDERVAPWPPKSGGLQAESAARAGARRQRPRESACRGRSAGETD
jgi:hypothetical protein